MFGSTTPSSRRTGVGGGGDNIGTSDEGFGTPATVIYDDDKMMDTPLTPYTNVGATRRMLPAEVKVVTKYLPIPTKLIEKSTKRSMEILFASLCEFFDSSTPGLAREDDDVILGKLSLIFVTKSVDFTIRPRACKYHIRSLFVLIWLIFSSSLSAIRKVLKNNSEAAVAVAEETVSQAMTSLKAELESEEAEIISGSNIIGVTNPKHQSNLNEMYTPVSFTTPIATHAGPGDTSLR